MLNRAVDIEMISTQNEKRKVSKIHDKVGKYGVVCWEK